MSHATLENVTDLSKMQILQQQVQHPHAGAPRLSGSTVPCCACRLVPTTLLLLDRTPRDFQYLLNMQWQYRLPRHTSVPQHIWVGVPGPVHRRSVQPSGSLTHCAGHAAATGTALAAGRKESLETEEMPSVSRINLSSCREGCSSAACKNCACLATPVPGVLGFLPISQVGAGRARVVSL